MTLTMTMTTTSPANVSPANNTPAKPSPITVDQFADQINISWQKNVESILATAKICAEATSSLGAKDLLSLVDKLHFGQSTFSKMVKIGNYQPFSDAAIVPKLPAKISVLYLIAQLKSDTTKQAIKNKKNHPAVLRKQIEEIRPTKQRSVRSSKRANAPNASVTELLISVRIKAQLTSPEQISLDKWLHKGKALGAVLSIDAPAASAKHTVSS